MSLEKFYEIQISGSVGSFTGIQLHLLSMAAFLLAAAKSLQSCPTLCDPKDGSPPGSPVPGILQARTLEWVAISSSNAWKWKVKVKTFSCCQLFETPRTAASQAPLSMGLSRQEYWSGVPLPSSTRTAGLSEYETLGTQRLKYLPSSPLQKKFSNPCCKWNY